MNLENKDQESLKNKIEEPGSETENMANIVAEGETLFKNAKETVKQENAEIKAHVETYPGANTDDIKNTELIITAADQSVNQVLTSSEKNIAEITGETKKETKKEKYEKIDELSKTASEAFKKVDIDHWDYVKLFDKIYSEKSDNEEIVMRSETGEKILALNKEKFSRLNKEEQIAGILGMIDLQFNTGNNDGAISDLNRYSAILDLAEDRRSPLKDLVSKISNLRVELNS